MAGVPVLIQHDLGCRYARPSDGGHSDAAKRLSDAYNLHRVAAGLGAVGKCIAVQLEDGHGDGVLYDDKSDAVRHQRLFEKYYAFVRISPASMNFCQAESVLYMHRTLYGRDGFSEGGRTLIPRLTAEDQASQILALARHQFVRRPH